MLTKEEANRITNRQIARFFGSIKDSGISIPEILESNIKDYFHRLKRDLTDTLDWKSDFDI
jgi:hypothetical protein